MVKLGKRIVFIFLSTILFVGLTFGGSSSSSAEATITSKTDVYHYVAFGDSITVGYDTKLYNYGMIGLTSEGLMNYLQAVSDGTVVTATDIQAGIPDPRMDQLLNRVIETREVVKSADLITITIGGNGIGSFPTLLPGKTNAEVETLANGYLDVYSDL